jgi:hypothetical protein
MLLGNKLEVDEGQGAVFEDMDFLHGIVYITRNINMQVKHKYGTNRLTFAGCGIHASDMI